MPSNSVTLEAAAMGRGLSKQEIEYLVESERLALGIQFLIGVERDALQPWLRKYTLRGLHDYVALHGVLPRLEANHATD